MDMAPPVLELIDIMDNGYGSGALGFLPLSLSPDPPDLLDARVKRSQNRISVQEPPRSPVLRPARPGAVGGEADAGSSKTQK